MRRIQYNQERLAKLSQSVVFRQPERLYDGYLQKLDRLTTRLETFMSQDFERKQKSAEFLRQRLHGLNLSTRVKNYQDRRESLQRLLVTTTKNTINGNRVRLEKAQDALLSLDTSRIVARGYAIVKIVTKLETGDVALEDAIAEFQKGMVLSKDLQKTLEDAEKTLVKVMQADGTEMEMDA